MGGEEPEVDTQPDKIDWKKMTHLIGRQLSPPALPSGAKRDRCIPSRDLLQQFAYTLVAWVSSCPAFSTVIMEVFQTLSFEQPRVERWINVLGPIGNTRLYKILVNKCAMGIDLRATFIVI